MKPLSGGISNSQLSMDSFREIEFSENDIIVILKGCFQQGAFQKCSPKFAYGSQLSPSGLYWHHE